MNYEHLKTFIAVVEKKSFSEAARALHMSQPTVSSHIKSLEKHLDTTLFKRTTKHMDVTHSTEILYRHAREIIKLTDIAENEIKNLSMSVNGRLAIACSLTIGESVLPKALGKFKRDYPLIQVSAKITNTEHILAQIRDHSLHIGLIEAPIQDPDLILESFMEDELVLIAAPDFFPNGKQDVKLVELSSLPLILREQGSGTRKVMEDYLIKHGLNPSHLNILLELGSNESIKLAVESKLGVSILSKDSIKKEEKLQLLKKYGMNENPITRNFFLVYHRDTILNTPSELFVSLIKDADM